MAHSTITLKVSKGVRDALILASQAKKQSMQEFILSVILVEAVIVLEEQEKKLIAKKDLD
jgi:uncharacterized protein (DUF1778 family)